MISTPANWNRSTIKRAPDLKQPSVHYDIPIHPPIRDLSDRIDGKKVFLFPDLLNKIAQDGTNNAHTEVLIIADLNQIIF
jgi:hypothetical protein